MATLVEYSDKLQRAVDLVVSPLGIREKEGIVRSGRSTFTDSKGGYGGGGSLQLLKLTTPPNGDGGAAIGKIITVNPDGTYTEENTEVSVICLALN